MINKESFFYPDAIDWMWNYCVFLGRYKASNGKEVDLGIHIEEDSNVVCAAIVHSNEPGNYSSSDLHEGWIKNKNTAFDTEGGISVMYEIYDELRRRAQSSGYGSNEYWEIVKRKQRDGDFEFSQMKQKKRLADLEKAIDEHINSGKVDEFFREKSEQEEKLNSMLESRWKRFINLTEIKQNEFLEKLMNWYDSDKYVEREYKIGYEPRRNVFHWFFDLVGEKLGKEYPDGYGMFVETCYTFKIGEIEYVAQMLQGQGCAIVFDKIINFNTK